MTVLSSVRPPVMGWNSWYCCGLGVSDQRIREVAHALVDRGLAAHGWTFVNIDDGWQGARGGRFNALQGGPRFPDMIALGEEIHRLGLHYGLYSTPWISSYAGFPGGSDDEGFEERVQRPPAERLLPFQYYGPCPEGLKREVWRTGSRWLFDGDAKQWAEWGVDLVKVDWKPNDVPTTRRIAAALKNSGRDILLSLSNEAPLVFAEELLELSTICRISADIHDTWESISKNGFEFGARWAKFIRPGHYIDPDMLQIGALGTPNEDSTTYHPTGLTLDEERTQLSLWSLLSAPLLLSCDVAGMDDATFRLLTNDAVIAVDQSIPVSAPFFEEPRPGITVVRKELGKEGTAVGVFNRSDEVLSFELPLTGSAVELWTEESFDTVAKLKVPPHGVKLLKNQE